MPKWVAEEKAKKKKDTQKAATKPKSQSSSVTKPKTTTPKATKAASKSTFLGGGETVKRTEQKQATVKKQPSAKAQAVAQRAKATNTQRQANRDANLNLKQTVAQTSRTRTAQAETQRKAAQQQKMTAGVDYAKARTQTRAIGNAIKSSVKDSLSADNRAFAQRQKSGTLTAEDNKRIEKASERRSEIARNTGAVAKKAVKDTLTGYGKTMADVSEMTQSTDRATYGQAAKLGIDKDKDTAQWNKLESNRKKGFEQARQTRLDLQKKQDERQAEWDERTKNAKGLEKAWYGAVESGTGMLADTAVGAVTGTGQFGALASMGLRTYGTTRGQAEKEGATAREDRLYSLAQAGKETATELMFQGAGLAKAAYGKTGLSLADKSANILTRGLTGVKADVVGAGVRALGGTAEENVEELAGWIADPLIKELTYGKNVRNRMKENLRANIPQIGSEADAAHVASYFSTPKFTDDLTKEYVKSGLSKDKASELAAEMRDYYVAYYSGDKEKLDALETDLAAKLSGQDKLSFKSWSMDELKDTFASTTLLTLATGIPGAVNSSVKGNRIFDSDEVKAVFGDDAVKKVADAVKNTSNKEMSLKAETMKQRLDTGKDLTGTQKFDLYQGYLEKVNETAKKARASQGVIENAREEQNLVPTMGVDRAGNTVYAKETQREYNEKFESTATTAEALRRFMESDNSISDDEIRRTDAAIKAVSDLHVGGLTVGDAHEFAYGNDLARETLKAEEGIDLDRYIVRDANGNVDLAATNEATENALFEINAANAIKAAQAETEVYIDDTRGNIDKDLLTRFGNNGQAAWKEVNKDLDPRDLKNYLTTANAASYFYSAGRNTDMSVNEAIDRYADTFKTVDNSVLEKAFTAGAEDRIIANTPGYGQTVEAGSNIKLKKTKPIITGQLIMDKDVVIPDSDQSAYLALAMSTNSNIHIVGSLKSSTGAEINGMSHGNDIYLNVNSAAEANLGYVFMHEMTHQIKQYAPNEYLALENLVRDKWFNKDAVGMQSAIKQRIDLYSAKGGQQLTEEEAVEEIIADAMAEAMDDPNFAAEVCEKDINLGQEILNSIRTALRSIRQMFANVENTNDRFHNSLLSYLGILDEAEKMWINALATARQNKADGLIADWQDRANKQNAARLSVTEEQTESMETTISDADRKTLNNEGIEELNDGTTARYSVTSWGETNKDKKLKALVAAGHNKEAASKWIDDINSIASIILGDQERLDYEADRSNRFLKPNGDYYKYTLDASTLCDKRRIYQGTYNAIQHAMPDAPLLQEDVVRIRTLLKDYDHKAPCGICYVESQRKNLGQYAKEWYDNYARKGEIKLADVTTSDGLKELKKTNPEVASDFEKAMAAKGVSSPKVVKLRTDYREDIMRMRPDTVKYLNDIGGLRFHSFSDFETPHLIDTMQAVMDMSAKGLKGMAYAKVPNFAAVFGPTGIKINLSLIAKTDENGNAVHDENGRLVFDSVEGIPYEEASKWRDAYPDNVAFILVGKDKEHTLEAINDDRVDFVIPFHRSKWSAEDMRRLGLIGYEDFATGHQENGIFVSQYWNYEKTGKENAEAYLELCAKEGVAPVFEQLLKDNGDGTYSLQEDGSTDNYWKLLVEGKMYNHFTKKGAPQKLVQPNFNMDEARRVLNEYEGGANTLPVADDVVKAFIKEYKQNHPDVEIADAKMSISVDIDDAYMDAVNSGNMDEAQRLVDEAAKEAGYTTKAYHGTGNRFTVFDKEKSGKNYRGYSKYGKGLYFADSTEQANHWGKNRNLLETYLDLKNPHVVPLVAKEGDILLEEYNKHKTAQDTRLKPSKEEPGAFLFEMLNGMTDDKGFTTKFLQERGYDGVIAEHVAMADMPAWTEYVVFEPEQIKSADTVTYAEDGSVIPLSERFDPTNNDIRYSLPTQDSDGKILTDGQMEYFKESQARDEQGRLVPVYHGTQNGGFTIFDSRYGISSRYFFFVDSMSAAKGYSGSEEMFNESVAGEEDMRLNYKVYLDMVNPLIVDAQGNSWAHIPYEDDFVTTNWLAEYAESEGYDGVIVKNVIDRGSADTEYAPQTDYIVFNSNQIKDTRNENPSENPDIRYSITPEDEAMSHMAHDYAYDNSYEALAYYEDLIAADASIETTYERAKNYIAKDVDEFYAGLTRYADGMKFDDPVLEEGRTRMAKSKQDYFNSNVAKWNQNWLTDGEVLDIKSVKKAVKELVMANMQDSDTDRKYKTELVNKMLIDIRLAYYYAKQGRTDVADALLWHSAFRMVDGVGFYDDDGNYETYKKLRDYFKDARLRLGDEYWRDVDYAAFRKRNYGKLNLVKGETNIDKIFGDLYEEKEDGSLGGIAPEYFTPEAFEQNDHKFGSVPDTLLQIEDVLLDLEPYAKAYSSEYCAKWATDIASDLLDIMQNGKELQSIADKYTNKYEAKIKAMKARHAEAMLKVRQQRDEGIKREKAKFKEYKEQQKEKRAHSKYFDSIQKTHKKLTERLLTNTADKNIPEQYKRDLAKLLAAFDLQTVGSKKYEARTGRQGQKTIKMAALKTALNNIENKSHEFHVSDAITDIIDELLGKDAGAGYNRSIEGLTIDELSASELERIDKMLKALLHEFNTYRNVRVGAKRQQVEDIGKAQVDSALEHAKIFGAGRDYQNIPGGIDRIINLDEVTPTYMFRHIDPEKSGLGLMFRELRRSFDKYVRNQEQLNGWMNEIVGKYHKKSKLPWKKYGAGELENWRSENYAQTFNLENGPVTLTPAQMMSLYCLSKRTQAYNHMTGAGIVVAPVSFNAKIMSDLKKKPNKALPVKLTDADIKQIVSQLTPDQIKVADDLQKLMADKMAAWGNEASMDVLGIELFGEPDYFPIKSDKAALETDLNANEFVEAIRNFGFAKAVQPGARNAIMVDDIFNVVTEHCNNMNLYNAYSAAMNDFMKVYNYRDFRDDGSEYTVKQAVAHAYGSKATTFIMTFMRDLNGNVSGRASGIENLYNSLLGNAKKAAVFANLRVAAQQPTAITRAFAAIHPKYLKGIAINEKAAEGIMNEMFEHCPIALWKSWGYYDINMGKSIEDIMMNNGRWLEDAATELYGYLDNVTWSAIWQMVKAEMKDTHPEVKVGTDEYWELCNERMTEVVDLTQVVDSPFHRSHAMRDKGIFVKAATSFMAEPTLTFNLLRDGVIRSREAWRKGDKAEAAKIAATIGAVALLQAGTVAGAAGLIDALRKKRPDKDDEDEGFLHLWWVNAANNFHDELKVWNKIYFIKDIASIFNGWENSNLALQGIQKFALGYRQLTGDPYARSSAAWYENVADGIGYMTGVPVKTVRTGLKNAMGLFGVSVSALDSIGEKLDSIPDKKKEDTEIDESSMAGKLFSMFLSDDDETLLDKYAKKKGYRKKDEPEKSEGEKGTLTESELRESIRASMDAFDEKYNKLSEKAAENAEGKTGNARNEALWDVLSEGYTKSLAAGNMAVIQRMRDEFEKNGGDVSWFDAKITDAAKSEYKKTLYSTDESAPGASTRQRLLHDYMTSHGVTDEEISDICYHSALAKDLKAAMRIGKEEYIMDELVPLVEAGLTREDYERLYKYRNYGANKYNGKYSDPEYTGTTGTFIWPASGTITSHFGYRNAPTAGASSNHPAIDIAVPVGTPVAAADGGTVIYCGRNSGYGISVGIKHANGMVTYYNHLSGYNVNVGDQVAQGQQIAQSGNTGISTGPHLDFKILDADGNPVDPEQYLSN